MFANSRNLFFAVSAVVLAILALAAWDVALAIIAAIVAGSITFAGVLIWRSRDRDRRQAHDSFSNALLHALQTTPVSKFDFKSLVAAAKVEPRLASDVAEGMFARLIESFLADGRIDEKERGKLSRLGDALLISPKRRTAIENEIKQKRYSSALHASIQRGALNEQQRLQLDALRSDLGLTRVSVRDATGLSAERLYSDAFRKIAKTGSFTERDANELQQIQATLGLLPVESSNIVRHHAMAFLRERIVEAAQDGRIDETESATLIRICEFFRLDDSTREQVQQLANRLKQLGEWREGKSPQVATSAMLEGGEVCHWDTDCRFVWTTTSGARRDADGRLIVTTKRIMFSSASRSFAVSPSRVLDMVLFANCIELSVTSNKGTGSYFVGDSEALEAVICGVVRRHKYLLAESLSSTMSRHIPDDVKREVWTRDGGRCTRCDAMEYLEFDHIIPHAKGGANTVKNVQLLCRKCNALKSDRI